MPRYLLPLLAAAALHAGVMDFHTLAKAKAAYEKGDYAKASEYYGELGDKNDAARYNYADALYQQKKYKEAAEVFSQIASPALKQKALHNLGNSLALSGKTDDALKAYEAALKLGEDKDTRYNLELLKKQKQQNNQNQQKQKNDQDQKGQDQKNDQQSDQNKDGQQDQKEQQKNGQDKNHRQQDAQKQEKQENPNKENDQNREGQAQTKQDEEQKAQKQQGQSNPEKAAEEQRKEQQAQQTAAEKAPEKQQNAAQTQAATAQPISDMEERKYNKLLDKRGIKTLMIPLSGKGEPHADETTPW